MGASLAGVSLGLQSDRNSVYAIFTAIASHKAAAAFSIGCAFLRCGMTNPQTLFIFMTVFSFITPIGILIGCAAESADPAVSAVLEGIAAGTFIYVGTVEVIGDEFETQTQSCEDEHGHDHKLAPHTHTVHEAPARGVRITSSCVTPPAFSSSRSRNSASSTRTSNAAARVVAHADERAFAISMVNRYTHRPYMNSEVLEYLQLRYIKNVSK